MNRMWEIKESFGHRHNPEIEEAYNCGFEDGYEKAIKEIHSYGERRMSKY